VVNGGERWTSPWRIHEAALIARAAIIVVLAGKGVGERLEAQRSLRWFAGLLIAVAVFTAIRARTGLIHSVASM
jgi:hypothetical protein